MAKKQPRGLGCLGVLLIVGFFAWRANSPKPPAAVGGGPAVQAAPADNLVGAVREAQHIVEQRLKNPADAKWPGLFSGVDLRTHVTDNGDGSYAIKSYVDATTPLGVRKRLWYTATARGMGNQWAISDVQVDD
jgi:hypothetical protein